jgi:micrococcal nuclease
MVSSISRLSAHAALSGAVALFAIIAGSAGPRAVAAPAPGVDFAARVVSVADGDTVTVVTQRGIVLKVRLANVDAPEKRQPFGFEARRTLSDMVEGREVRVRPADTDRYGRTVAVLSLGGREVNRHMVEVGAAWAYRRYLNDPELVGIEDSARRHKLGLWAASRTPLPPWEWRALPGQKVSPMVAFAARPPIIAASAGPRVSTSYRTCAAARAGGAAPLYRGDPGYSPSLDRDNDGVACELQKRR